MLMTFDYGGLCEMAAGMAGVWRRTGMRRVCIGYEMGNPNEKSCLLSPKIHELFGQYGSYVTVLSYMLKGGQVGRWC